MSEYNPLTADRASDTTEAAPPLEWLENQLCELAGHLTAATHRFLVLLGDFDARQGWAAWDLPSCAAWLSWKCQMASGTAREQVRVARALRTLPVLSAEFAAGRMSYAKARALTRIATPDTEAGLAELAGPMTANQLERFARAHRQVSRADDDRSAMLRRLSWRQDEDGSLTMTVRLPPADGAVVLQALRAAASDPQHCQAPDRVSAETPAERGAVDDEHAGSKLSVTPACLADAFVGIASAYLNEKISTADNADLYHVIVHVGADELTDVSAETPAPAGHAAGRRRCHIEDGPAISPLTARIVACDATISWMLHDAGGSLLDIGRRRRAPTAALRRAVRERDGYRCAFPGCNSRKADIHHIKTWASGGKTKLGNLLSLCRFHHTIVHKKGYLITATLGGFDFARKDGTVVPASPALPEVSADISACHGAQISMDTIVPGWYGDKLDLDFAIWACFASARIAEENREPAEPQR
jgi:hypothetical protein